jgi:hypothetical protein
MSSYVTLCIGKIGTQLTQGNNSHSQSLICARRFTVRISAETLSILADCDYPNPNQADSTRKTLNRPWPLPFTSFSIHFPVNITSIDALQSEVVTVLLYIPEIKYKKL